MELFFNKGHKDSSPPKAKSYTEFMTFVKCFHRNGKPYLNQGYQLMLCTSKPRCYIIGLFKDVYVIQNINSSH